MHVGQGVAIPKNQWDCVWYQSDPREFVRELSLYIFGEELKTHTISGKGSNASTSNTKVGKLKEFKVRAIEGN